MTGIVQLLLEACNNFNLRYDMVLSNMAFSEFKHLGIHFKSKISTNISCLHNEP